MLVLFRRCTVTMSGVHVPIFAGTLKLRRYLIFYQLSPLKTPVGSHSEIKRSETHVVMCELRLTSNSVRRGHFAYFIVAVTYSRQTCVRSGHKCEIPSFNGVFAEPLALSKAAGVRVLACDEQKRKTCTKPFFCA